RCWRPQPEGPPGERSGEREMLAGRPHQRESNGSFPRAHKKNEKVAAFFRSLVSMRTDGAVSPASGFRSRLSSWTGANF
ncbi:MAG: hypothetical protein ABSF12_25810, partial [Bryobacteraceae bacterium]